MKKLIFILISMTTILSVSADEAWKDKYFKMYPEADTDTNGELSWPEYKVHKQMKDEYFKKNPDADTNKDGKMGLQEYRKHKKTKK